MEKFWIWLSWHLPRNVVYWCAIRLMATHPVGDNGPTNRDVELLNNWRT